MKARRVSVDSSVVPLHWSVLLSRLLSDAIRLPCMAKRGCWNLLVLHQVKIVLTLLGRFS